MAEHQSLLRPRDEENDDASSQNRFASSFASSKTWTKVLAGSGALVLAATLALSGIKSNSSSSLTSSGGTRSHHLGGEAASVQPNASETIKLHTADQPAALGEDWAGEGADGKPIKTWFCNKCKNVMDNRQSYSVGDVQINAFAVCMSIDITCVHARNGTKNFAPPLRLTTTIAGRGGRDPFRRAYAVNARSQWDAPIRDMMVRVMRVRMRVWVCTHLFTSQMGLFQLGKGMSRRRGIRTARKKHAVNARTLCMIGNQTRVHVRNGKVPQNMKSFIVPSANLKSSVMRKRRIVV